MKTPLTGLTVLFIVGCASYFRVPDRQDENSRRQLHRHLVEENWSAVSAYFNQYGIDRKEERQIDFDECSLTEEQVKQRHTDLTRSYANKLKECPTNEFCCLTKNHFVVDSLCDTTRYRNPFGLTSPQVCSSGIDSEQVEWRTNNEADFGLTPVRLASEYKSRLKAAVEVHNKAAKVVAEKEENGFFSKSNDSRCLFSYTAPLRGQPFNQAGVTKEIWDNNLNIEKNWFDYLTYSGPYQLKPVAPPKFIYGRLLPHDSSATLEKLIGKQWHDDYTFFSGLGHQIHIRFSGKSQVPCGFVAIFFNSYKLKRYPNIGSPGQVGDPVLEIHGVRFFPDRMKP